MPRYLTATLHAPLASFGAVAVGERREGWDRPGRSALLGLVAACLGLDRADEEAQTALSAGLGLALRRDTERPGPPLSDYHTAQVPPARRGVRYATRREELAAQQLETVLSRREYRSDALFTLALWMRGAAPRWGLEAIAAAMERPVFTPCLGRRSCPLGLPLAPRIVEAADPLAALAARAEAPQGLRGLRWAPGAVFLDAADLLRLGIAPDRIETRRDAVESRRRWQFALREEAVVLRRSAAP